MRDDFTKQTAKVPADGAGNRCSNPDSRKPTSGPRNDRTKAVNIGVAAQLAPDDAAILLEKAQVLVWL
jgi:hypothetical protein